MRVLVGAGAVLIVTAGVFRWLDHRSMTSAMLSWARLAPIPDGAQRFRISKSGTMFSREFRASFVAPPEVVASWLAASPGIQDATIERDGRTVRYLIEPGGGAQSAELEYDEAANIVEVHVSAS